MNRPSIDELILTKDELRNAREQVQQMAYFKWLDAGRPLGDELQHWLEAELEWIEYFNVPDRFIVDEERDG